MKLTTLVEEAPVRERIAIALPRPDLSLKADLLVPRVTSNPQLIGTAYDYILRFHLQRAFPFATEYGWLPESVHGEMEDLPDRVLTPKGMHLRSELGRIIRHCRRLHSAFIAGRSLSSSLLQVAIQLAHCDMGCRSGLMDALDIQPSAAQVKELARLVEKTNWSSLRANSLCLLNPVFGHNCPVGADADLLLDDMLIEVKTTVKLSVTGPYWRQMLGYLALNEHFPIGGGKPISIRRIGFYFSRHGYLASWPLAELLDLERIASFAAWLQNYARRRLKQEIDADRIAEQAVRAREVVRRKPATPRHPKTSVTYRSPGRTISKKKVTRKRPR